MGEIVDLVAQVICCPNGCSEDGGVYCQSPDNIQKARKAIIAVCAWLDDQANVAIHVKNAIGADWNQQIALGYAEAEFRHRIGKLRQEAMATD